MKACVWREVEVVGVGDVASLFPETARMTGLNLQLTNTN